jgi:endoglucanase
MYKTIKSTNRLAGAIKRIGGIVGVGAAIAVSQGASASCTYSIQSDWNSGFVANITIKNDTGAPINGWNVSWQYSANRMSNGWSANYAGSNPYTATNMPWNGSIGVGQSVTFGFQGVKNNSAAAERPTVTGAACNGGGSSAVSSSSRSSSISSSSRSSSISSSSRSSSISSSSRSSSISSTSRSSSISSSSRSSSISSSSRSSSISSSSRSSSISSSSRSSSISSSSRSSSSSSSSIASGSGLFRVNTQGNLTKDGQLLPARCGNWFGLEGRHEPSNDATNPSGAPMEMYAGNMWWVNNSQGTGRTLQQTMTELKAQGITMLRLPIAPQTLDPNDPQGQSPNLKNHPSIRQTNARQALEDFIKLADQNDIQIFIDIHSCSNFVGWRAGRIDARPPYVDKDRIGYDFRREDYSCATTGNPSSVTKIHAYDKTKWLANIREIAGLPAKLGVDNLIGIDIFNEPWDYTWAEWKSLSEEAYQAIDSVNPNMIIIVEGLSASANNQDGTPDTKTPVPHGSEDLNPNWGENLFEAGSNPINIPKDRLLFSPHIYGPSVFVQKQHMDPSQTECVGLEGDEAALHDCRVVINPTLLEQGWEEHFGYLRQLGYGMLVGEFGGNMDWPNKTSPADRSAWSHITTNVDQQWQQAAVSYMKKKGINACYWSMNPESADTFGWYLTPWDPVSANDRWGEWTGFDPRKTQLLNTLWGN